MAGINYLLGLFKHFLNGRISNLSLIDNHSKFHKRVKIYRKVKIVHSTIDAYTYIAPKTELFHADIGKFCSIGRECLIGLPSHSMKMISTSPIFTSKVNATKYSWTNQNNYQEYNDVFIGNDVWIGSRSIIMGGVHIGNGAIVGAGAIVTKDIPDYAIAAGVPAKIIKYRFEESIINKLLDIQWWNLPEEFLIENIEIYNKENIGIEDLEKTFKYR